MLLRVFLCLLLCVNSAFSWTHGANNQMALGVNVDIVTAGNFPLLNFLKQGTDWGANSAASTVTISIASPAVITLANHGLQVGVHLGFLSTGSLPSPLSACSSIGHCSQGYYVCNVIDTSHFSISATSGGACLNTTGTQSGTQSIFSASLDFSSLTLDANSYPTTMAGAGIYSGVTYAAYESVITQVPAGTYYIEYTGTCSFALGMYNMSVGTITNTSAGRDTVSVASPGNVALDITSEGSPACTSIAFIPAAYETQYLAGKIVNPDYLAKFGTKSAGGPGFVSYRFMDALLTNHLVLSSPYTSATVTWAGRTPANAVNFGALSLSGSQAAPTGWPLEAIYEWGNETCGDIWLNMPQGATPVINQTTMASASVSGTTLTIGGAITGTIAAGSELTGSSSLLAHSKIVSGSGTSWTVSPGGQSVSSTTLHSAMIDTTYMQNAANLAATNIVWCPGQHYHLEWSNETFNNPTINQTLGQAIALWNGGNGGDPCSGIWEITGAMDALYTSVWKTTLGASHIKGVIAFQNLGNAGAIGGGTMMTTPCWSGGQADSVTDEAAFAPYWGNSSFNASNGLPLTWLTPAALSGTGLDNWFAELMNGGKLVNQICPTPGNSGFCSNAAGLGSQTNGSGYVNGTYTDVLVASNSAQGYGAGGDFTVSGGAATLTLKYGGANFQVGDVLTVPNSSLGGSGSGWTVTVAAVTGADYPGGWIQQQIDTWTAWVPVIAPYGLAIVAYEGGEQNSAPGGSNYDTLFANADADPRMTAVMNKYFSSWRSVIGNGSHLFNYYKDIGVDSNPFGTFAICTSLSECATDPRYAAATQQLH